MPIRILAPQEAAKIAAGEVIERPASVVKELIENSLDAGARQVAVEIREGGVALIRVADDGCGIEPGELRLAFERHATSKVAGEDDLWRIATLGFRGEALPSIAAAGDVELISRVAGNDVGARIKLRDGAVVEEGSGAASPGTTLTVRRLFSAQTARLKFLRAPGSESSHVSTAVMHYALAYPEVRFTLVIDGRTTLQTSGAGDLVDALAAVYGTEVAEAAIVVEAPPANEGEPGVRGLAVAPRLHRASRNYIGVYVNRRWVKNRALTFAIEEAYQGMLPVGRHPIAVLDIRVPPDEVDVNVHPTKAEVRLRREREVFAVLQRAVRRVLSERAPVPATSAGIWSGAQPTGAAAPLVLRTPPVQPRLPDAPSHGGDAPPATRADGAPEGERLPVLRAIGQVGNTYVIAEGPEGMYLLDQHAAHERVLYERCLAAVRAGRPDVQGLLEPLTLELGAAHRAMVEEHRDAFERLGFDIEHFGDATYVVRTVPAPLAGGDVAAAIVELFDRTQRDDGPDEWSHRVAASLACHAAVRAGMTMGEAEQRELLRLLEEAESPRTCPHGRPTMLHLTSDAIAREFRRR
ncbi:MAG: DNA mismatch repair endonuclease MutL [Dehalococcoidia bacterium]